MTISGTCDTEFLAVREEFERNFDERGELGASVCVMIDGRSVVDLWGGTVDPATGAPWTEDTVCMVWSSTKGATALCAHLLVDRGLLDLDALMTTYWPEYGQAGKETTTVRMVLSHQAGVVHVRAPLGLGAMREWDTMTTLIAAEAPFWEPGTRHGYHALTFGWMVGELIRRIDGRSLGRFFAEEIADPLGIDFWIGLPESEHHRVAPVFAAPLPDGSAPMPAYHFAALNDPDSPPAHVMLNNGGFMVDPNSPANWVAEIPAANGITNGRGLAAMYNPLALGGVTGGVELVGPDSIARMGMVVSAGDIDAGLLMPTRFSLGFMKSVTSQDAAGGEGFIMSEPSFGHCGAGGSVGFADPSTQMAFGYAMNQQGGKVMLNERGQSLVDATYRALGFRSRSTGAWR